MIVIWLHIHLMLIIMTIIIRNGHYCWNVILWSAVIIGGYRPSQLNMKVGHLGMAKSWKALDALTGMVLI